MAPHHNVACPSVQLIRLEHALAHDAVYRLKKGAGVSSARVRRACACICAGIQTAVRVDSPKRASCTSASSSSCATKCAAAFTGGSAAAARGAAAGTLARASCEPSAAAVDATGAAATPPPAPLSPAPRLAAVAVLVTGTRDRVGPDIASARLLKMLLPTPRRSFRRTNRIKPRRCLAHCA